MSDDERRSILEAVAAGRMDPTDAADALADLDAPAELASDPPSDEPEPGGPGDTAQRVVERRVTLQDPGDDVRPIEGIKVDGSFRSIEIVGDDDVRQAVAEGPHRVRWVGDLLVIDGSSLGLHDDEDDDDDDDEERGDWFRTYGPRRAHRSRMTRGWDRGWDQAARNRPLRVRVNPDVPLQAHLDGGPLTIRRVRGPIKARVSAGPLVIEDFESPIDVRVAAGKVSARGRVDHGVSTINCDAGKVSLHLEKGSDVRVNASATLGKVDFGHGRVGGRERARRAERYVREHDGSDFGERIAGLVNNALSDEHEVVFGHGTGVMEIRVSMGAASISYDDEPTS